MPANWGKFTVLTRSETVKFQGWGQPHLERNGVVSQTTYLLLKHKPRVRSHRVTGLLYFFFFPVFWALTPTPLGPWYFHPTWLWQSDWIFSFSGLLTPEIPQGTVTGTVAFSGDDTFQVCRQASHQWFQSLQIPGQPPGCASPAMPEFRRQQVLCLAKGSECTGEWFEGPFPAHLGKWCLKLNVAC